MTLSDTPLTKESIAQFLLENGFTKEEVDGNLQNYVNAIFAIIIEDYLGLIPEVERSAIVSTDNMDTPEGFKSIMSRFEKHFQENYAKYQDKVDTQSILLRIKSYA